MEWEQGFHAPPGYYVCADCVADDALKVLVAAEASAERCDFCEREAEEPIAADTDLALMRISESLRTEYSSPEDAGLIWDNEDDQYSGAAVSDIDEVLQEVTDFPLGHPGFEEFVLGAFRGTQWCERDPFGIGEADALRYGWEELRETVKHQQRFFFVLQPQDDPSDDPGFTIPRGGPSARGVGAADPRA